MQMEDLEQVAAIDRLSFSLPWPENSYHYELVENRCSLLKVAETESKVVGVVVVWLIEDEAHIATIAVHPDYRGTGISCALLADMLVDAIRKGARLATLEVRAGNRIAQALYKRFGFDIAGRRPRYYRDNFEDALIMTALSINEEDVMLALRGRNTPLRMDGETK
jgi:ribosomal-protein-alanine N-acetyltransferase